MSEDAVRFLLDQLDDLEVSSKRMFGGHGIFRRGHMFALVYDGTVYVKMSEDEVADSKRPAFQPRAGQIFPTYREVSAEELEDEGTLTSLMARAQHTSHTRRP